MSYATQRLLPLLQDQPQQCTMTHGRACCQVTAAEGFDKARLFSMLDGLEERTRPLMQEARAALAADKGAAALEPHNIGHALAGVCVFVC